MVTRGRTGKQQSDEEEFSHSRRGASINIFQLSVGPGKEIPGIPIEYPGHIVGAEAKLLAGGFETPEGFIRV